MAKRGRKPIPVAVRLAEGTYEPGRHGPLPEHVIGKPEDRAPKCPPGLGKHGKAEWKRIIRWYMDLKILEARMFPSIEALARNADTLMPLYDIIKRLGVTMTVDGVPKVRPEVKEARQLEAERRHMLVELGLTPSAATRIRRTVIKQDENNPNAPQSEKNLPGGVRVRDRGAV